MDGYLFMVNLGKYTVRPMDATSGIYDLKNLRSTRVKVFHRLMDAAQYRLMIQLLGSPQLQLQNFGPRALPTLDVA